MQSSETIVISPEFILRHMPSTSKTLKGGIQTKRLKAAWDYNYLLKVLSA
ncbi:MAG: hypothetical protein U5J82_04280 [Desulfobacterales bacterium]|nr:hypothetical protein [Desulfobacterales bacterium]